MTTSLPSPTSLILVAVINDPRDLEIARMLGWYRIPLRSAPKVIAVDYLAFYQTASFGDQKWCLQYLAPVRGYELTTRLELLKDEPDHPHAAQEYYKIQLGPLIQLPTPILADAWRRITFFYSTGECLLRARTIRDLVVPEDERPLLWQALRERASSAQNYQPESATEWIGDLDLGHLAALLGIHEADRIYSTGEVQE
jgi:hypothetical protein